MCYTYTMYFYLKNNEVMSFAGKWMQLKTIVLVNKANCRKKLHIFIPHVVSWLLDCI